METFNCPTCSGPLDYSREAGTVVTCRFCGQSVIVPERVQGASERAQRASAVRTAAIGCISWWTFLLLIIIGLGAVAFFLLRPSPPTPSSTVTTAPATPVPPADAPEEVPAGASFRVVLSFGEEGIGPGGFEDARHIALDGEGYLYVGEYTGGRIQRFDPTGKFITQWLVDTEQALRGLAADRNGVVYVVQRGEIRRYQGATGEALGTWSVDSRIRFDGVYPALDGGMLAFGGSAGKGQIVRFDAQGQARLVFETQARNPRAALDGLGNIYVMGGFSERGGLNEAVFKHDPEGRFINRFGSLGSEPGQFRAPHALAVDGRGRVYVSDINGLQVFDGDGRFLERLEIGRTIFGLIFNDKNELFVVERNAHRVMKVVLE